MSGNGDDEKPSGASGGGDDLPPIPPSSAMGGGGGGILGSTGDPRVQRAGHSEKVAVEIQAQMDKAVVEALMPHQQALAPLLGGAVWAGISLGQYPIINSTILRINSLFQTAPPAIGDLFAKTTQLGASILGKLIRVAGGAVISLSPSVKSFLAGIIITTLLSRYGNDMIQSFKNNKTAYYVALQSTLVNLGMGAEYAIDVTKTVFAQFMIDFKNEFMNDAESQVSNADTIQSNASGLIKEAIDEANSTHADSAGAAAAADAANADADADGGFDSADGGFDSAGAGSEVIVDEASKLSEVSALTASQNSQDSTNSSGAGGAGVANNISVREVEDNLLEYLEALNNPNAEKELLEGKESDAAGGGSPSNMDVGEEEGEEEQDDKEEDDEEKDDEERKVGKKTKRNFGGATRRKRRNKQNKKSQRVKKSRRQMRRRTRRNSRKVLWM